MAPATAGIVFGSYQRWGLGVSSGSPRTCWATMTLRAALGEAASIWSMNVSYPTPFWTMRVASETSWATLVLASKVWGSVFGLSRIDDTETYLPPICWSTLAYSFSAPTAWMIPDRAGAVDPDVEQAASPRLDAAEEHRGGHQAGRPAAPGGSHCTGGCHEKKIE